MPDNSHFKLPVVSQTRAPCRELKMGTGGRAKGWGWIASDLTEDGCTELDFAESFGMSCRRPRAGTCECLAEGAPRLALCDHHHDLLDRQYDLFALALNLASLEIGGEYAFFGSLQCDAIWRRRCTKGTELSSRDFPKDRLE
jgi:hypothetical protein